mmetsp:Transcript_41399/g.93408  ORF Transcript_41399/g.93408 Transcript_41399/m.93408 type:complete len:309 (+) Transcript_41399:2-928(+)
MIWVPAILWLFQAGPFYTERYTVLVPILVAVLQVFSTWFLLATALSDPGIIPRQQEYAECFDARTKTHRNKAPPRHYDLLLHGHSFKLKYCTTCSIYRPPRCTHCSVCDNCIERFDHHCPWIGNCIGKRNYWLFYSFVSFTGAVNTVVLATSVAQLGVICSELQDISADVGGALLETLRQEPLTAAVAVYCVCIVWFTVGLCGYHNYLVCTNQTTYEQIKGTYSGTSNPFNRGLYGNCQDVLGSPVRPRYFNPFTGLIIWPRAAEGARELHLHGGTAQELKLSNGTTKLEHGGQGAVVMGKPSTGQLK